jgi:hypothetical protein
MLSFLNNQADPPANFGWVKATQGPRMKRDYGLFREVRPSRHMQSLSLEVQVLSSSSMSVAFAPAHTCPPTKLDSAGEVV